MLVGKLCDRCRSRRRRRSRPGSPAMPPVKHTFSSKALRSSGLRNPPRSTDAATARRTISCSAYLVRWPHCCSSVAAIVIVAGTADAMAVCAAAPLLLLPLLVCCICARGTLPTSRPPSALPTTAVLSSLLSTGRAVLFLLLLLPALCIGVGMPSLVMNRGSTAVKQGALTLKFNTGGGEKDGTVSCCCSSRCPLDTAGNSARAAAAPATSASRSSAAPTTAPDRAASVSGGKRSACGWSLVKEEEKARKRRG
mmetsp:Transcript_37595/g.64077  ORF Transcript_37595/g.64077 Transcript_37595/m.64077 type:complete len:253 (-) Transcript_37595:624-1382(-)